MRFKSFLVLGLASSFSGFAFAQVDINHVYTECLPLETEDLRNQLIRHLSEQISVSSQSQLSQQRVLTGRQLSSIYKDQSSQTSNIRLQNIDFDTQESQLCASVGLSSIVSHWQATAQRLDSFAAINLPADQQARAETLDRWIEDLDYLILNFGVVASHVKRPGNTPNNTAFLSQMEKTRSDMKDLRAEVHLQSIRFVVTDTQPAKLVLNGKQINQGEQIYLPVGRHSYSVTSFDGEYKRTGTLVLKESGSETISYDFRMDRRLAGLSQGMRSTLSSGKSWLGDVQNERALRDVANSYKDKTKRFELTYSFAQPSGDYSKYEDANLFRLSYLDYRGVLRYGYGAGYGESSKVKSYEVFGTVMLQAPTMGADSKPMHIRSIAIIPAVGLDLGLGYYQSKASDGTTIDRYSKSVADAAEFGYDNLVVRGRASLDFVIMKELAVVLGYEYAFRMNRSQGLNLGVNVRF